MSAELPLGEPLAWSPARPPVREPLRGTHVLLRPIDAAGDAQSLYAASHPPGGDPAIWTYLPDGPYENVGHLQQMLAWAQEAPDRVYFAIVPSPGRQALGLASYLNIEPAQGTIEIGHIWFGGELQRTTAATEAIHLLARHIFDLGYRRLEWKCNALNAASCRAAERFGFTFEGVFRQHQVIKGRNRDTAWYAILDRDWPAIDAGFRAWLHPANFTDDGRQRRRLGELIAAERGGRRLRDALPFAWLQRA